MTNLIVAFRNYVKASKKVSSVSHKYENPPLYETLLSSSLSLSFFLSFSLSVSLSLSSEASLRSLILIMRLITAVGEHDMLKNRRVKYALRNDSRRMF
jgi:hypothetical protein